MCIVVDLVVGGYCDYWFVFGGGLGVGVVCCYVGCVGILWLCGWNIDEWFVVGYFVGVYCGWFVF